MSGERGEVFQIATLRRADLYGGAPALVQPGLQPVKDGNRGEHQARRGSVRVMLGDEHGDGFTNIASVNSRPCFLALDDALVSMQHNDGSEVAFAGDADSVTVPVDLA